MINQLEIAERIRTGEKMETKAYDMGLFRKTQELTKRHNLAQTGKPEFWDVDNAYADAVFDAGVDFLAESGVFCVTSERVVKFTEDEVRRAAREIPSQIHVGEGSDSRVIRKRDIEDTVNRPSIVVAGHSAWSDQVPVPIHIATREMVADDRVDVIQSYMYAETDRYEISDPAHWAYAARRAVERVRNGCTQASASSSTQPSPGPSH
jgi:methylamine--corrinoid protein Co-methyltransferase